LSGKRILVITHNFVRYPEDPSGQFLFTLYRGIQDEYRVIVLCPHEKGLKRHEQLEGITIHRYRYWMPSGENIAYGGDMQEKVKGNILGQLKFIALILCGALVAIRIIFSQKIDIIHCHWWIPGGISGWLASIFTGKALVVTSHGTDIVLLEKAPFLRRLAGRIYNRCTRISTVSNFLKNRIVEMLGISEKKIDVFPMPFDSAKFNILDGLVREKGYLVAGGRLNYRKGYDFLIRACSLLKEKGYNFRLDIIGDGPERQKLSNLIEELGLAERVKILGFIPHSETISYYRKAEIFVLPAIKEGFGLVFVEALASGTPVISADSGGVPDIIQDGITGLLVPPENAEQLAQAIAKLLDHPELAAQMAMAGNQFIATRFSPFAIAEQLAKLYDSIA